MTKVVAVHRVQRRHDGKRVFHPPGGVFEVTGKEYSHLLEQGAVRNATKADIANAEDNPALVMQQMPFRAKTLKEQEAIARAKKNNLFGKPSDTDEDTVGLSDGEHAHDREESESEEAERKAQESIDAAKKEEARLAAEAEQREREEAEAAAAKKGGKPGKKNLV